MSDRYQTREEDQGICHLARYGVMGAAPAQPRLFISMMGHTFWWSRSHWSRRSWSTVESWGQGTERLLVYAVIQGMSWEEKYKPRGGLEFPAPGELFP